jgi:hypothetical protein
MVKLVLLLLLLGPCLAFSQVLEKVPKGSKPNGDQTFITLDGRILVSLGVSGKVMVLGTRKRIHSQLLLKAFTVASIKDLLKYSGKASILIVRENLHAGKYSRDSKSYTDNKLHFGKWKKETVDTWVFPEWFGAKGDGKTDDCDALNAAFSSPLNVYLSPKKIYNTAAVIEISGLHDKTIIAAGATVSRTNNKEKLLTIFNSRNVAIIGGKWQCASLPVANGVNSEHAIQFASSRNVRIEGAWIYGSPEMGIAFINCIGTAALNNRIEKCFRDGIHHIYTVNIKCSGNVLRDIKDDAIAVHDYGLKAEKTTIIRAGYPQSGIADIYNNDIENAVQGIASIGCTQLNIHNNIIKNTVGAGIAVFGSDALKPGGTASPSHIKIVNNKLISNCGGTGSISINGNKFINSGQASTGVAALFVGTLDGNNAAAATKKRLTDILISGNNISESGVGGTFILSVDKLTLTKNKTNNCCIEKSQFSGTVNKIYSCTLASISNNTAVDNRSVVKHYYLFDIQNTRGKMQKGVNKGWLSGEYHYKDAQLTEE